MIDGRSPCPASRYPLHQSKSPPIPPPPSPANSDSPPTMAEQLRHTDGDGGSNRRGAGELASPAGQGSFAEVTIIDSQFQHFSGYIDVIQVFKCRLCTFCSPLEHVIVSHMSEVHFPRRCFLCKQCLFVFEDRAQLASHLDSAHGTKSIAVCFSDLPPGSTPTAAAAAASAVCPSPPPPSLRMMMRTAEGDERLPQPMMEEASGEEALNGRVTSSTGNLANMTNNIHSSPTRPDCVENVSAEPGAGQPEGGRASEPPTVIGEARQDHGPSRSSSCHPSSSNQVYSSPEIIDIDAGNLQQQQPQQQQQQQHQLQPQQPQTEASPNRQPPNSELRVTIGNTYCQSYIKTEPISPVRATQAKPVPRSRPTLGKIRHDPRSYMRRWSLTENSLSEDSGVSVPPRMSRSFDVPGSESVLENGIEEEGTSRGGTRKESTSQKSTPENKDSGSKPQSESGKSDGDKSSAGKGMEKGVSLDTGKGVEKRGLLTPGRSYHGGRSVDGRPPRLVRQSVVEESPRSSPQLRVVSEESAGSPERTEAPVISAPASAAEAMRREHFSRSFPGTTGRSYVEHYPGQRPPEGNPDLIPTLRDLVSNRMERGDRSAPPSAQGGSSGSPGQEQGLPVGGAPPGLMRPGRIRSYSISEGDVPGFPKGARPGGPPNKSAPAQMDGAGASERDYPPNMHHKLPPGNPQVPPMVHHPQYPGLVYQPYSIEGEPKHLRYFSQGLRMARPGPMEGPPHPLRVRPEENGQLPGQNHQPMEDTVLYQYLRNNGGRKYRRNSFSVNNVGDVSTAGLKPSHGPPPRGMVPQPDGPDMAGFERQRGLLWPPRHHHPDHPFPPQQGPFPPQVPPYPMAWKDKFDGSQVSPNASAPGGEQQRHAGEYNGTADRDGAGRGEMAANGPPGGGVVVIEGQVVRAKPGEGGESNQDLAKDITRQVQQAMGVTQALYTPGDRHLPPWMESQDRPESPDEPMEGDALNQRRSRKSTFNIYREIPERKRKLDHEEEEKIKHSYNPDGSFDYFSLTGWKAYKCDLCKKRRFKTASELQEHKQRKHGLQRNHSSQGSLNGLPEAASALTVAEGSEANDSPPSG